MKKKPLSELQRDRKTAEQMAFAYDMEEGLADTPTSITYSYILRAIRIGRKRGEKHAVELAKRAIELRDLLHEPNAKNV